MYRSIKKIFLNIGAILAWTGVILQLYLALESADSRLSEFFRFISFMTIWTNLLLAIFFTTLLAWPESKLGMFFDCHSVQSALLDYILIVGLIYHLFLAHIWNPQGYEYVADQILHTAVPAFYLLYWIFVTEKEKLPLKNVFRWLIYPVIYIVIILIRGAFISKYPYYFIDVSKLGYPVVFRNIILISVAYFLVGLIIVAVNNLIARNKAVKI